MDRNTDRWWFDKGYSLGVTETQRDAVVPRLLGAWILFGLAVWSPLVAGLLLVFYTLFTVSDWRRRKAEAEHKRDYFDPGTAWEWE